MDALRCLFGGCGCALADSACVAGAARIVGANGDVGTVKPAESVAGDGVQGAAQLERIESMARFVLMPLVEL